MRVAQSVYTCSGSGFNLIFYDVIAPFRRFPSFIEELLSLSFVYSLSLPLILPRIGVSAPGHLPPFLEVHIPVGKGRKIGVESLVGCTPPFSQPCFVHAEGGHIIVGPFLFSSPQARFNVASLRSLLMMNVCLVMQCLDRRCLG